MHSYAWPSAAFAGLVFISEPLEIWINHLLTHLEETKILNGTVICHSLVAMKSLSKWRLTKGQYRQLAQKRRVGEEQG